jgi:hypothetical protein
MLLTINSRPVCIFGTLREGGDEGGRGVNQEYEMLIAAKYGMERGGGGVDDKMLDDVIKSLSSP